MTKRILLLILWVIVGVQAKGQQCQNLPTGFIPITDLGTDVFHGMQGGLYGKGQNNMPGEHLQAGLLMSHQVLPRNAQGADDPDGKIGFISMGMSNANQFFSALSEKIHLYSLRNPHLVVVNAATGGYDIDAMLNPGSDYWKTVEQKLAQAGLSNQQVQVIWFMQAKHITGIPPGEGLEHIQIMEEKFLAAFRLLKERYPNLKQIFCSGRDYGGYSNPGRGNPEPYAYYTNWAFRKLIDRQLEGDAELAFAGDDSPIPWIAWANNVWADGVLARSDGFNWLCPQDVQDDGVHPSQAGQQKVANMLFEFFLSDPTTSWFRQPATATALTSANSIRLFPNPVGTKLFIQNADHAGTVFQIRDLLGKTLIVGQNPEIDVSELPPGIYLVTIFNAKGSKTLRFVKR